MKNTSFDVEDVSGDVISKDKFIQKQTTKLDNFLAKKIRIIILVKRQIYLNMEKNKK